MNVQVDGQQFAVRIDTTSGELVVPDTSIVSHHTYLPMGGLTPMGPGHRKLQAMPKMPKDHDGFSISSATPIDCHSTDCVAISAKDSVNIPSICDKKSPDGSWICAASSDNVNTQGVGSCEPNPKVSKGVQTACKDHLNPSCGTVLGYGYTCSQDMGIFGIKGKVLSDYCPESCGKCPKADGPKRYCRDNDKWTDAQGNNCQAYAQNLKDKCFSSTAYFACPQSCGACGDCCAPNGGCFFSETFHYGGKATGSKFTGEVSFSDVQDAPANVQTNFAVASYTDKFEPNAEVDGVWGLAPGKLCNPACSPNTIEKFMDPMNAKIGLCLDRNGNSSSMDIGNPDPHHYTGSISTIPLDDVAVANHLYMVSAPSSVFIGNNDLGFTGLSSVKTVFDINTQSAILLPEAMMTLLENKITTAVPSIAAGIDTSDAFGSCTGPLPKGTDWKAKLPTITFKFGNTVITLAADVYLRKVELAGQTRLCPSVTGFKGSQIVFGLPVIRTKYFVFDRAEGSQNVGVAEQGDCSVGTPTKGGCVKGHEWQCDDGACIPADYYRDSIFDCLDGSDEAPPPPPPPPVKCPFPAPKIANGYTKISAGSDYGKLVVTHCNDKFQPSGDQVVYCNKDRAGEWEKPVSTCVPAKSGGGGGGSCTEKQMNGMTCGGFLQQMGRCPSGKGCKQSDCNWAANYRFDCSCSCKAASSGPSKCDALKVKVQAACTTGGGNVFGCPNKDLKITNCGKGKCKSDQCGDGNSCKPLRNGGCSAYGSSFVACKPCNVCALPCTLLLADHSSDVSQCNIKLPGAWGVYAGMLLQICK